MTYTVQAHQLPNDQTARVLRWNCDEYIIAYNRKTRVLTVEEFEGFDDDTGAELTRACGEQEALTVLDQYQPGWPGLDGWVLLKDYYGPLWTIGTEPI